MKTLDVTYHLSAGAQSVESLARAIALEQTVEVPESLIRDPRIEAEVVGKVVHLAPLDEAATRFEACIRYNLDLTGYQVPQLLNLLYGNISLKDNIRLVDFSCPEELLRALPGPRYGIEGLRAIAGVHGRPLLATALKPMGSPVARLAEMAGQFARGGGDIVKDDHNFIDPLHEAFVERVRACHAAVQRANDATGRQALYFPSVTAPAGAIDRAIESAIALGVRGLLLSPFLIGLDQVRRIAAAYPTIVMAHPAFSGAFFTTRQHGWTPAALLGKLFRLLGADASVFPNYGGRFLFNREECIALGDALRSPLGNVRRAFPAPAGGMQFDRIEDMAHTYGSETIFLIGGALLAHADDVARGTRAFLDAIRAHFEERLEAPVQAFASACEVPARAREALREVLPFASNYTWVGRLPVAYKIDQTLPFEGVARHELIGQHGEETAFDLRYFEIAPGGYTSLERHRHTHTLVVLRGEGTLVRNGEAIPLAGHDIAYVGPMETHQLRNDSQAPFGFLCIVNHERDRPLPP